MFKNISGTSFHLTLCVEKQPQKQYLNLIKIFRLYDYKDIF